jgi:hypothetical protein
MAALASLTGIDHVLLAVRNLDRARMGWTRLGFSLSPRGRHIGWGTANYCIMFSDDYLELIGIVDPLQPSNGLDAFLARREGPMGIAFAGRAADETAASLARRGLHPGAPRDLARQIELPEGTDLLRFTLVHLPAEETPALPSFVCQHQTPERLRRPQWLDHANGAAGLDGVTVLVDDTAALREPYERMFGADVAMTDEVMTVHCGPHRIVFASVDDFSALYPEAEPALLPQPPALAVVMLKSRDLSRTADHLTQWQVAFEELADGAVLVPPGEANGALLVFTAESAPGRREWIPAGRNSRA